MAFVLIWIWLLAGCSESVLQSNALVVSPLVIDFGKVRPTDSPIRTAFSLRNNGDHAVTIVGISTGCSCTAVDLSGKTVAPHTEISIPVTINVHGRSGEFNDTVLIKTDPSTDPILLSIKGIVETDVWHSGQAIRCTVAADNRATAFFELHTIKYPNLQFDLSPIGEEMIVQELSRLSENGRTTIKFSLSFNVGEDDTSVYSLDITPKNENIDPITLPVQVFREKTNLYVPPALTTRAIYLGTINVAESRHIEIHGDSDIIGVIDDVSFTGTPDSLSVKVLPSDEKTYIRLVVYLPEGVPTQTIEGKVTLTTRGRREFSLPIFGQLITP